MDHLMQALRVDHFERLLRAYSRADISLGHALDGGAGSGATATKMLPFMAPGAVVHAYEPFPGNHRFLDGRDARIRLHKVALSDRATTMRLAVPGVVTADSDWGRDGMEGYSSAGHLAAGEMEHPNDVIVDCVRADDHLANEGRVGFVKLDLQGGELRAVGGMEQMLRRDVALMWLEYGPRFSPPQLVDHLQDLGFLLFDTQYLFRGTPKPVALKIFEQSATSTLSSGSRVWYGYKRRPWRDYAGQVAEYSDTLDLVQTDLCCVNIDYLGEFMSAAPFI